MNKKIPLLFLAILIIGVAFILYYYNISLEQFLKANNQLLTSQGKTKLEIDNTLLIISAQYKSNFLKDILILFLGVLIGAIPTFTLYRQQIRNQNKEAEIKIISDTLGYIFRCNNAVNNLLAGKQLLDKCKKEWPDKVAQVEKEMYSNFNDEIQKDFFPSLMLHSFHLKRLNNQSFWKDFESMMNIYQDYTDMAIKQKEGNEYAALENKYKIMMKEFVDKSIKNTKIIL